MPRFSIIVPIYNRPDEADELLKSLTEQTFKDFELVLVEDGSDKPCIDVVKKYDSKININYITKPNTGRSDTRNVGIRNARGNYFVFFDSDCIIPPQYFENLEKYLEEDYADCYGGPDNAHESFSDIQKAINYAMTSFFTTGGIRGGKINMEKFAPRTFNMGFTKQVYDTVGGFKNMFGEDIDLSIRIRNAGFSVKLYNTIFVYHKRRVNLKKFYKQVNIFGTARINLFKLYPNSLKLVHTFPALFILGSCFLIILSIILKSYYPIVPLFVYVLVLFFDSLRIYKTIKIAFLSVAASFIQLVGYGLGFISSFINKIILRKGLENIETLKKVYK